MSAEERIDNVSIQDSRLLELDIMDSQFVLATFSNGVTVKIHTDQIKQLAIAHQQGQEKLD